MIIQMHITDNELAAFFKAAGFNTEMYPVTEFRGVYHNRIEERSVDKLHVVVNGRRYVAKDLFERVTKERILTPDKAIISTIINIKE